MYWGKEKSASRSQGFPRVFSRPKNSLSTILAVDAFLAFDSQSILDAPDDFSAGRIYASLFNRCGRIDWREKLVKAQDSGLLRYV
jgi:hypothetical protein